jgi:hypothetical protein
MIVLQPQLRNQVLHGLRAQQISRAFRGGAGRDYEQPRSRVLENH